MKWLLCSFQNHFPSLTPQFPWLSNFAPQMFSLPGLVPSLTIWASAEGQGMDTDHISCTSVSFVSTADAVPILYECKK